MEGCESCRAFLKLLGNIPRNETGKVCGISLVNSAMHLLHWKVEKYLGWNPEAGMPCLQESSRPSLSVTVRETEAQRGERPWRSYPAWQQQHLEWSPFSLRSGRFLLPLLSVHHSPPANWTFQENTTSRGIFLKIDFTTPGGGITLDASTMQISGTYPDLLNKIEAGYLYFFFFFTSPSVILTHMRVENH